jgi:6-phospho-3-hexuloisomerase
MGSKNVLHLITSSWMYGSDSFQLTDTLITGYVKVRYTHMSDEVPPILEFMQLMASAIARTAGMLDQNQMAAFFKKMLVAKRVYVAGAGRSGFIAKAFGLRLIHLGYDAYVVGETITPAFNAGDTLVVFSGSGETQSISSICGTAKELGGTVCLITSSPDSKMGRIADCVVNLGDLTGYYRKEINSFEIRQLKGDYRSVSSAFAPLGTLFETMALVFSDAVISSLMEARKAEIPDMKSRLTNVE